MASVQEEQEGNVDNEIEEIFQEENDIVLAVVDHLIGNLAEQFCHAVIGIVITSNSVDHLDAIHQTWEGFFDCIWISIV